MAGVLTLPFSIEHHAGVEHLLLEWFAAFYVHGEPGYCIPILALRSVLADQRFGGDWVGVALERMTAFALPQTQCEATMAPQCYHICIDTMSPQSYYLIQRDIPPSMPSFWRDMPCPDTLTTQGEAIRAWTEATSVPSTMRLPTCTLAVTKVASRGVEEGLEEGYQQGFEEGRVSGWNEATAVANEKLRGQLAYTHQHFTEKERIKAERVRELFAEKYAQQVSKALEAGGIKAPLENESEFTKSLPETRQFILNMLQSVGRKNELRTTEPEPEENWVP